MASITIRNLDDAVKAKLRVRAASHGRSMEAEAREILKEGLRQKTSKQAGLGQAIHSYVAPYGGVELELPPRSPRRAPPKFD